LESLKILRATFYPDSSSLLFFLPFFFGVAFAVVVVGGPFARTLG
jgi:hypothetical protein